MGRLLGVPEQAAEVLEALSPEQEPPLALARELSAGSDDVLLVGHWPWVEGLVQALAAPGQDLPRFRTACLVGVESGSGALADALDPRRLA